MHITNNIAAGAPYAGFIVPGHTCGDYSGDLFKNNVAHSIHGADGGMGALIFPDPSNPTSKDCYEGSYFNSYKNYLVGAFGYFASKKITLS